MRRLVSFDDPESARTLDVVLDAANISTELRSGADDSCSVWVLAEPDMAEAQQILSAFVAQPDAPEYERARAQARANEAQREAAHAAQARQVAQVAPAARPRDMRGAGAAVPRKSLRQRATESPVTFALIVLCVLIALVTELGENDALVSHLSIVSFEQSGGMLRWRGYRDLLNGELWRLITPIFLHFGPFHLLFNAFWLNDLGAPSERFQGSFRFALFILWSAVVSNLAQLVFGQGPNFGGMSGVVYALVGYLWARGFADRKSGIALPGQLVAFFVGWMLLGFTRLLDGVLGPMANYCHLGGFVAGVSYGYIAGLIGRRRTR
jgi:GlpG protein